MEKVNNWRLLCLITFLISITCLAGWESNIHTYRQSEQIHAATVKELRAKEETLDLALEFGFDPMIVQVTQQLSENAIRNPKRNPLTWRFVQTSKNLAYLLLSIVQIESHGDYKAHNASGASGLTQLLFSTARQYDKDLRPEELFTIPKHLSIAMEYFVDMLEKYRGNYTLAILAWNRGPGTIDRLAALGESQESNYAKRLFTEAALRNAR